MITLYLVGVNSAKRGAAIRAVKAALVAAGMENNAHTMDAAEAAVYAVLTGKGARGLVAEEEGIATADDVLSAAAAFAEAVGESECALAETRDSDDEAAETESQPELVEKLAEPGSSEDEIIGQFLAPIPEGWVPSREASTTCAVIMGMCDGNAQASFVYAKRLAITTGSPQLYVDIGRVICLAYGFQPVRLA